MSVSFDDIKNNRNKKLDDYNKRQSLDVKKSSSSSYFNNSFDSIKSGESRMNQYQKLVDDKFVRDYASSASSLLDEMQKDYSNMRFSDVDGITEKYRQRLLDVNSKGKLIQTAIGSRGDSEANRNLMSQIDSLTKSASGCYDALFKTSNEIKQTNEYKTYKNYEYDQQMRDKYKGATYANLTKAAGKVTDQKELEWLNKYMRSDPTVLDSMTPDEIRFEKSRMEHIGEQRDKAASELDRISGAINHEAKQAKYDALNAMYNPVLYYNGDQAVTYDTLLRVKTAETNLKNIQNNYDTNILHSSLMYEQDDLDNKLPELLQIVRGDLIGRTQSGEAVTLDDRQEGLIQYFSNRYGLPYDELKKRVSMGDISVLDEIYSEVEKQHNENIGKFSDMGYDWNETLYYEKYKAGKLIWHEKAEKISGCKNKNHLS